MMNIYKLDNPKRRLIFTIICFIIIYLFALLYVFLYKEYNLVIPCIFHELTNLYCPGCGITRALVALSKLNFYEAFRNNAFVISLLPFLCLYYGDILIAWIRNKKAIFANRIPNYVWYIIIVLSIIFAILRNIPYFDFLAPLGE